MKIAADGCRGQDSNVHCRRIPGERILCKLRLVGKADMIQKSIAERFLGSEFEQLLLEGSGGADLM